MASVDSYEQDALRRRIRASSVGRVLLGLSVPLVVVGAFVIDNIYWERVTVEAMAWRGVAMMGWAAALLVTRPRLARKLREEHGLESSAPMPERKGLRFALFPAALILQYWVSDFSPGSVLGAFYLVFLAVGWQHLAGEAANAASELSNRTG